MPIERTVHIVDDDDGVRRALERLLRAVGFAPVTYATALDFLAAPQTLSAGCLLLDVRMPGMDGLALQERLNELGRRIPVIIMTANGDIQTAVRAMKAGAVDFIEKPFEDDALIAAIEAALAIAANIDREQAAVRAAARLADLSAREREVLDGLVAGHPNKVIAGNLGISVRTVEVHRARMLQRLGTRRLADAIRLAVIASLAAASSPDRPPTDAH